MRVKVFFLLSFSSKVDEFSKKTTSSFKYITSHGFHPLPLSNGFDQYFIGEKFAHLVLMTKKPLSFWEIT